MLMLWVGSVVTDIRMVKFQVCTVPSGICGFVESGWLLLHPSLASCARLCLSRFGIPYPAMGRQAQEGCVGIPVTSFSANQQRNFPDGPRQRLWVSR